MSDDYAEHGIIDIMPSSELCRVIDAPPSLFPTPAHVLFKVINDYSA